MTDQILWEFLRRGQGAQKAVNEMVEKQKKKVLFDSKCYELAEHFLADEPALNSEEKKRELAADIQWNLEMWIQYERKKHQVKT